MAYDNLTLQTSVVQAMQAAGLYKEGGKTPQETLMTIAPDGTTSSHLMAEIDYYDLKIFADELEIVLKLQNPLIQSLFAKNVKQIAHLIRGVNYNTRSGFKGSSGAGNALDAVLFHEGQFQDPDIGGAITPRTTWVRAVPVLGVFTLQFICQPDLLAANLHAPLALANNEAFALLGFANEAAAPCTTTVALQYLGVNHNIQNLSFRLANPIYGNSIIELKQPLFVWPNENALVNVRYYTNGGDELEPIGIWIKTAANLRNLITS